MRQVIGRRVVGLSLVSALVIAARPPLALVGALAVAAVVFGVYELRAALGTGQGIEPDEHDLVA